MVPRFSQPDNVNVLISNAPWAWPRAVEEIFQPRGVNALLARDSGEIVNLIDTSRIHLAILDSGEDELTGIQTLRLIRQHNARVPCILLTQQIDKHLLSQALNLGVFSVVAKPVDMQLLAQQINRLFIKYYDSQLFSVVGENRRDPTGQTVTIRRKISTVIKWSINKDERSND